jgi:uncharacterized protein YqiB (DUF1249 family)
MSQALARTARIPRLGRFGWLMALYAENHTRLTRLFAPEHLQVGTYVSSIGDGPDPSAFVRLYRDARQAEATHCYVGKRWQDVIGLYPPPAEVISHRMRMNTFLGKWLEYLGEQGHGVATLHPAGAARDVA